MTLPPLRSRRVPGRGVRSVLAVLGALLLCAAAVAAGGALAAASSPSHPPKPVASAKPSVAALKAAALRAGASLFADNGCGACHALAGARATGARAPSLDALGLPAAEIARQLTRGSISMPSFRTRLTATQIGQLAGYIAATAKSRSTRPRDPASLYRGYCGMCHALPAAGATGVTAVRLDARALSTAEVVNGIVQQHPLSQGFGVHLTASELAALARFVAAASGTAAAAAE